MIQNLQEVTAVLQQPVNPADRGLDLKQFGAEVARELGVDPEDPEAYGLTADQIRAYEVQLHSRRRSRSRV